MSSFKIVPGTRARLNKLVDPTTGNDATDYEKTQLAGLGVVEGGLCEVVDMVGWNIPEGFTPVRMDGQRHPRPFLAATKHLAVVWEGES